MSNGYVNLEMTQKTEQLEEKHSTQTGQAQTSSSSSGPLSPALETQLSQVVKEAVQEELGENDQPSIVQFEKNIKVVHCNAYVVFVVKSLTNLKLPEGTYDLNFTLVTYVLPDPELTDKMKEYMADHIKVRLDDKPGMLLSEKSPPVTGEWNHEGVQLIKFTLRDAQTMYIPISQQLKAVRRYPFDRYELHVRFEFEGIWIPQGLEPGSQAIQVRFNVFHQSDVKNGFHRGTRKDLATDRLPEYKVEFAARKCWGHPESKQEAHPVITYAVPVARISLNVVWTTIFPMMATQALLVLVHTVENNISVGDIATIMLALFAFLTSAREKVPVFPEASVLDSLVFCFVIQLIFACVDVLYEYFYPEDSAQNRPVFLLISTIFFGLQTLYVIFCWARSVYIKRPEDEATQDGNKKPVIAKDFDPTKWVLAAPKKQERVQQAS